MNDTDNDRKIFFSIMAKLRASYPSAKIKADEWKMTVDAWFDGLQPYSFDVIGSALTEAAEPDSPFLPNLPKVRAIAHSIWNEQQAAALEKRKLEQEQRRLLLPPKERRGPRPDDFVHQGFEALAQSWWDESTRLGLDPDKPTPREIGLRRWSEFRQTWTTAFGDAWDLSSQGSVS